jgi:hypothetical protein
MTRAGIALVSSPGTPPFPPGDAFAGGVGVIPHFRFLLPHPCRSFCPVFRTFCWPVVSHVDGMKLMLIAANDNLSARLFCVSHTLFSSGFVPCSKRMNGHCITADFATGALIKLYRHRYNFHAAVLVNWPVMKRILSPQITGKETCKLFRQPNNLNRRFRLTF